MSRFLLFIFMMLSLSGLGDKYLKIVTEQDIGVGVQAVNNIRAHTLVCYYEAHD